MKKAGVLGRRPSFHNAVIRSFLRDHGDGSSPYSICMHPSEHNTYHTFAAIINHLTGRCLGLAAGYPCQHEFATYEF